MKACQAVDVLVDLYEANDDQVQIKYLNKPQQSVLKVGYPQDKLAAGYQAAFDYLSNMSIESICFTVLPNDTFAEVQSVLKDYLELFDIYLVTQAALLPKLKYEVMRQYLDKHFGLVETMMHKSIYENLSVGSVLEKVDKSFSETVLERIQKQGKEEHEVYKKANIDRKHFSKIRSNKDYKPKKTTAIALGIALELSLDDFNDLLEKAGFVLSSSSKFDLIVRYFVERKIYDLFEINATLFEFTNKTL